MKRWARYSMALLVSLMVIGTSGGVQAQDQRMKTFEKCLDMDDANLLQCHQEMKDYQSLLNRQQDVMRDQIRTRVQRMRYDFLNEYLTIQMRQLRKQLDSSGDDERIEQFSSVSPPRPIAVYGRPGNLMGDFQYDERMVKRVRSGEQIGPWKITGIASGQVNFTNVRNNNHIEQPVTSPIQYASASENQQTATPTAPGVTSGGSDSSDGDGSDSIFSKFPMIQSLLMQQDLFNGGGESSSPTAGQPQPPADFQ